MIARFHSRAWDVTLLVAGGVLATLGGLGLVATIHVGGAAPSNWFILTASGTGREISGWTVTLTLASVLTVGLVLLAASGRRLSRHRRAEPAAR